MENSQERDAMEKDVKPAGETAPEAEGNEKDEFTRQMLEIPWFYLKEAHYLDEE